MRTFGNSRTLLTAIAVLSLAGAVSGLAAAGSFSASTPRLPDKAVVPAGKRAALANRMPSATADRTAATGPRVAAPSTPDPIPAEILGSDVPVPVPSSIITETNGWLVSNGLNLVAVYAGSAPDDSTKGRIVVVRQDLRAGKQSIHIVDAGATGPLSVAANAPAGAAIETSALTGRVPLSTSSGAAFKLNLGSDTISAN